MQNQTLQSGMTKGEVIEILTKAILGISVDDVATKLNTMGANIIMIDDIAKSGIKKGYDLGEGVRSGDPVLSVMFGLPRGWFREDERVRTYLGYDQGKINEIIAVSIHLK